MMTQGDDCEEVYVEQWGAEAHGGAWGWYYWWAEYPDEGSCGPYDTREEAVAAAEETDGKVVGRDG